jgi:hypothetical protein
MAPQSERSNVRRLVAGRPLLLAPAAGRPDLVYLGEVVVEVVERRRD